MRKLIAVLVLVAAVGFVPVAAVAGPPPVKPFTAEYVYLDGGEPIPGARPLRVALAADGLRVDYPMHVSIVEFGPAAARILMLDPDSKTYSATEAAYDSEEFQTQVWMLQNPRDLAAACAEDGGECELLGSATFAGRAAERWRMVDEEGEGEALLDPVLGIVLRSVSGDGSGLEIRNLVPGAPAPGRIGVPAGYSER